MTLTEFKIWMEGFSEDKDFDEKGLTALEWQKISSKLKSLEETKSKQQHQTYRSGEVTSTQNYNPGHNPEAFKQIAREAMG